MVCSWQYSTVNLGFDPKEIGTKLKFGTDLLWVYLTTYPKSSQIHFGEKMLQGVMYFVDRKAYFMKKLCRKQVKSILYPPFNNNGCNIQIKDTYIST